MGNLNILGSWFSFGDAWWALLLIPVALGLVFKSRAAGYLRKAYDRTAQGLAGTRLRGALPCFFAACGLVIVVLALMDFTRHYSTVERLRAVNRLFTSLDNSSSMYQFVYTFDPIYCADKNLSAQYPRIFGACGALNRLVDTVEAQAKLEGESEKDLISLMRFATHSFIIVPPTSDYAGLRGKIQELDWREQFVRGEMLGQPRDHDTEIHLALWHLYLLALGRNLEEGSGFTPLSFEDMDALKRALAWEYGETPFVLPFRFRDTTGEDGTIIAGLASRLKKELRDTVFIIITDGYTTQLNQRIDKPPYSLRKMLELAALLELPVYFISTDEPNDDYKRMARKTGFTLDGKDYHGDFLVANSDKGYAHLEELVASILKVRFGRTIPVERPRRVSYAPLLAAASLTFFVLAVVFRETVSRSLTDI